MNELGKEAIGVLPAIVDLVVEEKRQKAETVREGRDRKEEIRLKDLSFKSIKDCLKRLQNEADETGLAFYPAWLSGLLAVYDRRGKGIKGSFSWKQLRESRGLARSSMYSKSKESKLVVDNVASGGNGFVVINFPDVQPEKLSTNLRTELAALRLAARGAEQILLIYPPKEGDDGSLKGAIFITQRGYAEINGELSSDGSITRVGYSESSESWSWRVLLETIYEREDSMSGQRTQNYQPGERTKKDLFLFCGFTESFGQSHHRLYSACDPMAVTPQVRDLIDKFNLGAIIIQAQTTSEPVEKISLLDTGREHGVKESFAELSAMIEEGKMNLGLRALAIPVYEKKMRERLAHTWSHTPRLGAAEYETTYESPAHLSLTTAVESDPLLNDTSTGPSSESMDAAAELRMSAASRCQYVVVGSEKFAMEAGTRPKALYAYKFYNLATGEIDLRCDALRGYIPWNLLLLYFHMVLLYALPRIHIVSGVTDYLPRFKLTPVYCPLVYWVLGSYFLQHMGTIHRHIFDDYGRTTWSRIYKFLTSDLFWKCVFGTWFAKTISMLLLFKREDDKDDGFVSWNFLLMLLQRFLGDPMVDLLSLAVCHNLSDESGTPGVAAGFVFAMARIMQTFLIEFDNCLESQMQEHEESLCQRLLIETDYCRKLHVKYRKPTLCQLPHYLLPVLETTDLPSERLAVPRVSQSMFIAMCAALWYFMWGTKGNYSVGYLYSVGRSVFQRPETIPVGLEQWRSIEMRSTSDSNENVPCWMTDAETGYHPRKGEVHPTLDQLISAGRAYRTDDGGAIVQCQNKWKIVTQIINRPGAGDHADGNTGDVNDRPAGRHIRLYATKRLFCYKDPGGRTQPAELMQKSSPFTEGIEWRIGTFRHMEDFQLTESLALDDSQLGLEFGRWHKIPFGDYSLIRTATTVESPSVGHVHFLGIPSHRVLQTDVDAADRE